MLGTVYVRFEVRKGRFSITPPQHLWQSTPEGNTRMDTEAPTSEAHTVQEPSSPASTFLDESEDALLDIGLPFQLAYQHLMEEKLKDLVYPEQIQDARELEDLVTKLNLATTNCYKTTCPLVHAPSLSPGASIDHIHKRSPIHKRNRIHSHGHLSRGRHSSVSRARR
ncbi:hypothetical protein ACJJTC_007396 [Scirpophaga incertulas]